MSRKTKKQKSRGVVDTNVLVAGISSFVRMSDTKPFFLDLGVLHTTRHLSLPQRPAPVVADRKLPNLG